VLIAEDDMKDRFLIKSFWRKQSTRNNCFWRAEKGIGIL